MVRHFFYSFLFSFPAIPNLIRLIHGNTKSQRFLAKEFVAYWQALKNPDCEKKEREDKEATTESPFNSKWGLVSIANAGRKIKELASWRPCPDEGLLQSKLCWYVPLEVRQAYGLNDLTLPNQWHYTLAIKKKAKKEEPKEEAEAVPKPATPKTTPSGSLITKFTKKMSDEERKKQIKRKSATPIVTSTPKAKPKLPDSPFGPLSAFCKSPSTSLNKSDNSPSTSTLVKAVSPPTSNKPEEKKGRRVSILVSVPRGQEIPTQVSSQAKPCSNFPAVASTAGASESKLEDQKTVEDKKMSTEKQEAMDIDCVTLD
jgi:chromatin assembly factor 1 subunit A